MQRDVAVVWGYSRAFGARGQAERDGGQLAAVSLCAQDGRDPLACPIPSLCVLFAREPVLSKAEGG